MDPYQVLDRVVRRFKAILKENLVGIYLHGHWPWAVIQSIAI